MKRRRTVGEELPHELLLDIFSRLPAKSIGRFRCVSKSWCTQLTDPVFITMHLNQSQENKMVFESGDSICSFHYGTRDDELAELSQADVIELDHPLKSSHKESIIIYGYCNGILCLIYVESELICLWNPCTREYKMLPSSFHQQPCPSINWIFHVAIGFGYNTRVNDYEFVRVVCVQSKASNYSVADVYSLTKDSHRRMVDIPYEICWHGPSGHLVNGALHWVASHCTDLPHLDNMVVAFDIGGDSFREVPLPSYEHKSCRPTVSEFRGQLSLCCHYDDRIEVWVMKDYGVRESWTKLFIFKCGFHNIFVLGSNPLCCTENGCFLLLVDYHLVLYNPKSTDQIYLRIKDYVDVGCARNYKESIVRLNVNGHH